MLRERHLFQIWPGCSDLDYSARFPSLADAELFIGCGNSLSHGSSHGRSGNFCETRAIIMRSDDYFACVRFDAGPRPEPILGVIPFLTGSKQHST